MAEDAVNAAIESGSLHPANDCVTHVSIATLL